jgi:hypothetical protein
VSNKLYIVRETRPAPDTLYWWEHAEQEYKAKSLPTPPELANQWYNIEGYTTTDPYEFGHPEKLHHGADGTSCDDAGHCICGPMSTMQTGETWNLYVKFHDYNPLVFQDPLNKKYLERLEYNKKNNIEVTVEIVDADEHWNAM